jgi:hypothetical protein
VLRCSLYGERGKFAVQAAEEHAAIPYPTTGREVAPAEVARM